MFGIKMPWTRRKERLEKELAEALRLKQLAVDEYRRRRQSDALWLSAKVRINKTPLPYDRSQAGYIRHDTIGGQTRFIAAERYDNLPLMAAMQIATITTLDEPSGYCPPQSSASSYSSSYESPSCSYSSSSDSSSSSSDSSSSSSSSYD